MSANEMNPRKITSSFSKREKMRRNPFNRRNSLSISFAFLVHLPVVLPRMNPGAEGRNNGSEPQGQCKLAGLIALVCAVH